MDKLQPARLALTPDGIPISAAGGPLPPAAYGNPALARHVFMGGNDLPGRWQDRDRFVVLATGFGLGLNFLSTWQAWRNDPLRCRRLHFVAIESHPFTVADLASAHAASSNTTTAYSNAATPSSNAATASSNTSDGAASSTTATGWAG